MRRTGDSLALPIVFLASPPRFVVRRRVVRTAPVPTPTVATQTPLRVVFRDDSKSRVMAVHMTHTEVSTSTAPKPLVQHSHICLVRCERDDHVSGLFAEVTVERAGNENGLRRREFKEVLGTLAGLGAPFELDLLIRRPFRTRSVD